MDKTYDSSINDPANVTGFTINGGILTTWRDYKLTIQGGWSGISGDATVDYYDPSDFNGDYLSIQWQENVTVDDIRIDNTLSD